MNYSGGFTIFLLEMLKLRSLEGNGEDAFMGLFRIFGAIVFTHMAASVLKQGSRTPRSAVFYQVHTGYITQAAVTNTRFP